MKPCALETLTFRNTKTGKEEKAHDRQCDGMLAVPLGMAHRQAQHPNLGDTQSPCLLLPSQFSGAPTGMIFNLVQPGSMAKDRLQRRDRSCCNSGAAGRRAAAPLVLRLCASVGIEGITPHTLRHTFGSVAGDLGFSELTIRALLGHAAQSVTQGYVHIDEALKLAVTRTCGEIAALLESSDDQALNSEADRKAA